MVDGVILVSRYGPLADTRSPGARDVSDPSCACAGVVLNGVDGRSADYQYAYAT